MGTCGRVGRRLLLSATLFVVSGFSSAAGATEWFVAPGGTGAGTSLAPFGRIQDALGAAQAGDTITVRPGTYAESIRTVRHGSLGSPIVLRAANQGTAVVMASGTVVSLDHAYHIIDGLIVDGQYGGDRAMKVRTAADSTIIRNTEVRRSGRDCVSIGSPANLLIENSLVHHCLNSAGGRTDAHGISAEAVQHLTIRGTEIHTFSGDGIQVDPARAAPGWDRLTIEGCRIWLAPLAQSEAGFPAGVVPGENAVDTKVYSGGPRARLLIRNTEAWGFRGGLITNMAAFNLKENIDAVIDGATVWDSEIAFRLRAPAWVTLENAVVHHVSFGVRYEDNIPRLNVWNTTFGAGVSQPFLAASSSSAGLQVANVLLLGSSLPREASGISSRAVAASAFVSAASNDYHLAPGSLAIDAGISVVDVETDRDGTPRPQGAYHDIGAYEFCPSGGCGSTPPPPPPPTCVYTISPTTQSIAASGGTGTVTVSTSAECAWTASSAVSWITLGSTSGNGSGTASFTVAANSTTSPRTGTLTIAGQTFTVTQAATACSYTVSPTTQSIVASGGTGTITVSTSAGCAWTASSSASWATIGSATGNGSGSVTYTVSANTASTSRSATLTIAGRTFTVMQEGVPPPPAPAPAPTPAPPSSSSCAYKLLPSFATVPASGGSGQVSVRVVGTGCTWTTTNSTSWVTVTSGSGTGDGTARYTVAANTTGQMRGATLMIGGSPFTIRQLP